MTPVFFPGSAEFRKWMEADYQTETEILVGYYKVATGKPSMTWSESVDEALCFGWIDGIRKSIDEESYCIRFTPRNPKSRWSAVNIKKVEEQIGKGRMMQAGIVAFEKRTNANPGEYSYENLSEELPRELLNLFHENNAAWKFFSKQPPSYRKTRVYWVMAAKQETTRFSRLDKLIKASAEGKRIF